MRLFLPLILITTLSLPCFGQQGRPGRRPDRAPKLGTPIPKVSAEKHDGSGKIDLGKPKRLTVLVFGSYT